MGWRSANFHIGSDTLFGCLHDLTDECREVMDGEGIEFPADAFVFFAHQGYDYLYFRASEGDVTHSYTVFSSEMPTPVGILSVSLIIFALSLVPPVRVWLCQ